MTRKLKYRGLEGRMQRMQDANRLLHRISELTGLFKSDEPEQPGDLFLFNVQGRVCYWDSRSKRRVLTHQDGHWTGFSGCEYQLQIIRLLKEYIVSGTRIDRGIFQDELQQLFPDDQDGKARYQDVIQFIKELDLLW